MEGSRSITNLNFFFKSNFISQVLPVTFEKSFPYGVLTNTRVPLAADKVYSEDDILIIGAQVNNVGQTHMLTGL